MTQELVVRPERYCTWTLAQRTPKVIYEDKRGSRLSILSFCLNDPLQGPVVILPIFRIEGRETWE